MNTKDLEHETKQKVSLTTGAAISQEDAKTGAIIGQIILINQPNLRQIYAAQSPIIPKESQPRRLRLNSADVALWELEDQEDISDPTKIKSSNQMDWKLLAETLERSRKEEVDELRGKNISPSGKPSRRNQRGQFEESRAAKTGQETVGAERWA